MESADVRYLRTRYSKVLVEVQSGGMGGHISQKWYEFTTGD